MKSIIKSILILTLTAVGFSCADPELDPLQIDKVKKGTLLTLRGPQLDAIYFDGADYGQAFFYDEVTGTETFVYDTEFLAEDPASLESVEIFVIDNVTKARVPLVTISGSVFITDATYRGPWTTVSITLSSILTKINQNLSTPAGQDAFIAKYKDGIKMESDLNLKDGTKVLAEDLVAAGLYESDQFYPSQFMTYGVESIDDVKPVATTSLRGQYSKSSSGTVTRTVIPLKNGARDTLNITFDQKITTPPTVTVDPVSGGTVGAVTSYGTTGKTFYVAYTAGATYTGDVVFTIEGATSAEAAPLTGLEQVPAEAKIAVDNQKPINTSFTTGTRLGKGQSATITLKFNEAMRDAPTITIDPGTTKIVGTSSPVKATLSADGLTATYVYEYKEAAGIPAVHGDASVIIATPGTDRAGNVADAITAKPLTVDVGVGPAPTVVLAAPYDFGTQIKWTINVATNGNNPGGSTTGTVYYLVQKGTDAPPTGFVGGDVPAFTPAPGVTPLQSGSAAITSGTTDEIFSSFTPNGTGLKVYYVLYSNTLVVSSISAGTAVDMN